MNAEFKIIKYVIEKIYGPYLNRERHCNKKEYNYEWVSVTNSRADTRADARGLFRLLAPISPFPMGLLAYPARASSLRTLCFLKHVRTRKTCKNRPGHIRTCKNIKEHVKTSAQCILSAP